MVYQTCERKGEGMESKRSGGKGEVAHCALASANAGTGSLAGFEKGTDAEKHKREQCNVNRRTRTG